MASSSFDDGSLAARVMDSCICPTFAVRSTTGAKPDFLPRRCFSELATRDAIKEEMKPAFKLKPLKLRKDLIDFTELRAKKVFLTSLLVGLNPQLLVQFMKRCQKTGFDDTKLPVGKDCKTDGLDETFKNFNRVEKRNFYMHQWTFLAPEFERGVYGYLFPPGTILPFFWQDSIRVSGAFSDVFKVKIHKDHFKKAPLDVSLFRVVVHAISVNCVKTY